MADRSFGTGWPTCDRSKIIALVRNDGLRLPVHRELSDLVAILMDLTEAGHHYNIVPGWTWGYACRAIAGTRTPSNHSWGTAVDINAPTNPRRADRRFVSDMPRPMVDMWKAHGFRWGGQFSWPDPMHFEFMGSVQDARNITARLRRFLGAAASKPPAHNPKPKRPARRPYPGLVKMGDRGQDVRVWQQVLVERGYRIAVDGIFGPRTNHVVVDWQRKHGLKVDGIAGPVTWHSLLFA